MSAADLCRKNGWQIGDWITDNGHFMAKLVFIGNEMVVWEDRNGREEWWRCNHGTFHVFRLATLAEINRDKQ